ncbi:MAG: tetratricopeptide repeat protein [Rikenellaceae bacterium]
MKKLLFCAIALMVMSVASAQDLKATYAEGIAAYQSGDLAKAATLLKQVVDQGMDNEAAAAEVANAKANLPQIYYRMGGTALKSGDFEAAREGFTMSADYAELYDDVATMTKSKQWIGKSYELQGGKLFNAKDFTAALPIFENGYAYDPRNAKMANWLGICYCETGDFDKGLVIFDKVSKMSSRYADEVQNAKNNIVIYTNNQVAKLQENKNYDGLVQLADKMLATDPTSAVAAKVRLQAYSDKGEYGKVFELAESAAKLQTSADERSNVYFILGAAYNAKEMKPEAIAAFKKVTSGTNAATAKGIIEELSK